MPSPPSRPARLVLMLALLTACSGEDSGAAGAGDPDGFGYAAARTCSEVLDERDGDAMSAAQDAAIQVILWQREQSDPPADEREAAATALESHRDELERTRTELRRLEPEDAGDAAVWETMLDLFEEPIAELERRAHFARTGEGADAIQPGGIAPSPDATDEVLARSGLAGRDCETVFSAVGPLAAHREFTVAAASACTTIVSRRSAGGYEAQTRVMLDGVLQAFESGSVERSEELIDALTALVDEWEATVADFESVPDDDVPDAEEWAVTVEAARERASVYRTRLDLIESGSDEEVVEAFQPGALSEHPGFGSLDVLGLRQRDCRSLAS